MTWGNTATERARISAFFAFIALLITWWVSLDPFGLKSATERLSENWTQLLVTAPFYDSGAEDKIVVFLIDETYMANRPRALPRHWPIPYAEQHELLEQVLAGKPKALFIDFLYLDSHGEGDSPTWLVALLNAAVGEGIPVVIPELFERWVHDCLTPLDTAREELREEQELERSQQQSNSKPRLLKELHSEFRNPQLGNSYLGTRNCGHRYPLYLGGSADFPSPAMAMYEIYCAQSGKCHGTKPKEQVENYSQPLIVQWRSRLSKRDFQLQKDLRESKDQNQDNSGPLQCQHISNCPLGQFDYVVKKSFQTLWYGVTGTLHSKEHIWKIYEPCPAITTLSAAFIQNTNVDHKKNSETLRHKVKDSYVFVGSHVGLNPDESDNPIHGRLSGVYTHAMALDNLITYGENYIQPLTAQARFLIEALILFVVLIARWQVLDSLDTNHKPITALVLSVFIPLIIALVVIVLSGLVLGSLHCSMYDWIGVLLVSYLVAPPRILEVVERVIKTYVIGREVGHD